MLVYLTKEIADSMGVHPNTMRVYEEWGYLSPAPRAVNGYRQYDEIHLFQLKIARLAFRCEIIQGNIRNSAREVVRKVVRNNF
ncbi:MerR family transcriptional regulator [Cytobacillus stercorigallinarum]|uniref:MerR family transcriptional regulator n=1 Tax=Cytobacillus stercorigallinarum TaxID=2762240 RepID=UPI001CD860DD|nr:MerR family transcriptional regulator [Cytobacillus stercorigallinarum]